MKKTNRFSKSDGEMKNTRNKKKVLGLLCIVCLMAFIAFPVRRLVILWPAAHQQATFHLPANHIFRVVYDSRETDSYTIGKFSIVSNGKIQLLEMVYHNPGEKLKSFLNTTKIIKEKNNIISHRQSAPVPTLHLAVSAKKKQTILMDGKSIRFRDLFPDGAIITIKTVQRVRVYWWIQHFLNRKKPFSPN
jgi:hypothetical protein